MIQNKLNAKSVSCYTNTCTETFTPPISCAHDAADGPKTSSMMLCFKHATYQEITDSLLWHYEILSGILAATFLIRYCNLLDLDLDC